MKRISSVYFFPFLNTYKFQYLGTFAGKTVLRCTCLFRSAHFLKSFFLQGSSVALESGGKAPVIFGPKILFCSFPGVLATVSTHLVMPTVVQELHSFRERDLGVWLQFSTFLHADCGPRTQFFLRVSEPGVFGTRSACPFTATSVLKSPFFSRVRPGSWATIQYISSRRLLSKNLQALSLFPLTKWVLLLALRLQPIIWLLPPPHPVILLNDLHSFCIHPVMECR